LKVIYHCHGGAHSSVVAAHLHLGNIPMQGEVPPEAIMLLPEFDRATSEDWGSPKLVGVDGQGNQVYILGLGRKTAICIRAATSLCLQLRKGGEVVFVETLSSIGALTRIGGFTSKVLGAEHLGRTLAARGIVKSLERLRQLVASTKKIYGME